MSDDLLAAAERVRVETSLALSADVQSSLGQYFTSARAASLIAAMPRIPDADPIRILDPGAGSGILTAAIVARLLAAAPGRRVEVTAVEIDPTLIPALQRTRSPGQPRSDCLLDPAPLGDREPAALRA